MKPLDFLVLAILAAILAAVVLYLRREKKKGVQCIGCPYAGSCPRACGGQQPKAPSCQSAAERR